MPAPLRVGGEECDFWSDIFLFFGVDGLSVSCFSNRESSLVGSEEIAFAVERSSFLLCTDLVESSIISEKQRLRDDIGEEVALGLELPFTYWFVLIEAGNACWTCSDDT